MSIDCFAATVSDNDGAAFITKAEFDSMKNIFQQQINTFNTQIDSKIDTAISRYLDGIKIEQVTYLDSMLNKVNALAEDFYLDSSGNKVKYGYRTMARKYDVGTTRKPVGARTAFFVSISELGGNGKEFSSARFALDWDRRVGMSYRNLPDANDQLASGDTYQTGIYLVYDEDEKKRKYPINAIDEYTYYYYCSGAVRTYFTELGFGVTDATITSRIGTWTVVDEFKNERSNWSLDYGTINWAYDGQWNLSYSDIRCAYGTTFQKVETASVVPICGALDETVIALKKDNRSKMTLQEQPLNWNVCYTVTGWLANGSETLAQGFWNGNDKTHYDIGNKGFTFNYNCHPYETINLKDLTDYYSTSVLGEKVLLTDGVPVCRATANGYIDIKMEFIGPVGHKIGFGFKTGPHINAPASYILDSNLRDFNNVKYTTRSSYNIVDAGSIQELRIDVKKGDVIFIKCVDTTGGDYSLCGVKTQEIKQTGIG